MACTDFMEEVELELDHGVDFATKWLPANSLPKYRECCLVAMVYPNREMLYASIPRLLDQDSRQDLRRLYQFTKLVRNTYYESS